MGLFHVTCSDTKMKNQAAIEDRVNMYMTSPENSPGVFNYTPLSFSKLSSYKSEKGNSDTSFVVEHEYKGFNVANREVKRKAEIYFDRNYEVIGYRNIFYYNPLNKDSLKSRYRTEN
jgi:hypothetical protein